MQFSGRVIRRTTDPVTGPPDRSLRPQWPRPGRPVRPPATATATAWASNSAPAAPRSRCFPARSSRGRPWRSAWLSRALAPPSASSSAWPPTLALPSVSASSSARPRGPPSAFGPAVRVFSLARRSRSRRRRRPARPGLARSRRRWRPTRPGARRHEVHRATPAARGLELDSRCIVVRPAGWPATVAVGRRTRTTPGCRR